MNNILTKNIVLRLLKAFFSTFAKANKTLITMYNPLTISKFFINNYAEGGNITPMKLVKLVYISHGWYLGLKGEPLISESVEAWKYGPVIPSIYHNFKGYNSSPIDKDAHIEVNESLTDVDSKFLEQIWKVYGGFDGVELSAKTHEKDTPWDKVWNGRRSAFNYFEIPNKIIKQYYLNRIEANKRIPA